MTHMFAIPVALALIGTRALLDLPAQPGRDQLIVLSLAVVACCAAILLAPARSRHEPGLHRLIMTDAAIATLLLVATILVATDVSIHWWALVRLTLSCLLMLLAGLSVHLILPSPADRSRLFVAAAFAVLLTTPVWLAPLAELSGNRGWITNLIVAVSPLSAFSVALDFDFLRTNWFYEHSVIGSLRYTYTPWLAHSAVLAVIATLFLTSTNFTSTQRVKK
jgi:hypothetical protein